MLNKKAWEKLGIQFKLDSFFNGSMAVSDKPVQPLQKTDGQIQPPFIYK